GVEVAQAPGVFWRTVFVTFMPAYVLINNTAQQLLVGQLNCPARCMLEPGERAVFHWMDTSAPRHERQMRIAFNLPGCGWSGGFGVDGVNSFDAKVWPSRCVAVSLSLS